MHVGCAVLPTQTVLFQNERGAWWKGEMVWVSYQGRLCGSRARPPTWRVNFCGGAALSAGPTAPFPRLSLGVQSEGLRVTPATGRGSSAQAAASRGEAGEGWAHPGAFTPRSRLKPNATPSSQVALKRFHFEIQIRCIWRQTRSAFPRLPGHPWELSPCQEPGPAIFFPHSLSRWRWTPQELRWSFLRCMKRRCWSRHTLGPLQRPCKELVYFSTTGKA